jgi:hypothetical protein
MTRSVLSLLAVAFVMALVPASALAQQTDTPQFFRPYDQRGINVFETPKDDARPYEGFELYWGAAFAQQFQALNHSNEADPVLNDNEVNLNQLVELGPGFNLATANLLLGAQLADGIQVNLLTYLSARHHPEAWVKGGYVQVDRLPMFRSEALDNLMEYLTIRAGHFEINYGDAHFRRTDNGNAIYNPFVGNLIMDSFTTEIGGDLTAQYNGFLGVLGVTGGEINGSIIVNPDPERSRAPAIYAKLGFDRELNPDLRARLTGSVYTTSSSAANNTLYGGDRAGSRYYLIMENTLANATAQFTSGRFNPGFRDAITAFMINPFVKYQGAEVFGTIEFASGRAHNETEDRAASQFAVEALYRFLADEQVYVGARYNRVNAELAGAAPEAPDASINRFAVGGGWFVTPNVLVKAEYVNQSYNDFPSRSIFHEGEFNGFMVEGVVAF